MNYVPGGYQNFLYVVIVKFRITNVHTFLFRFMNCSVSKVNICGKTVNHMLHSNCCFDAVVTRRMTLFTDRFLSVTKHIICRMNNSVI